MVEKVETSSEVTARHSAIASALKDIPDFGDDFTLPGQAVEGIAETPAEDVQPDSSSTSTSAAATADDQPPVTRPVEAPTDPQAAKPATTYEAPKNWSEDRRKAFTTMPAEAQKLLLDMQKEASAGFTKYAQETAPTKRMAESVSKAFEPYRNELQQNGLDEAQAVSFLIREREEFNRDMVGFLAPRLMQAGKAEAFAKAFIEKSGLTPDKLFGGTTAQPATVEDPNLWVDPSVLQLRQEFQKSQQQLSQLTQHFRSQQEAQQRSERERQSALQQQQQREQEALETDLGSIIGSADQAGNPKYPHFDAVEETIVRLIQSDPAISAMPNSKLAEKFDLAYRRAVRLHDDLHQQEMDAEIQRRLAEQEKARTVQKAAAATTRKPGLGSTGTVKPAQLNRQDSISKAFGDLGIV